MNKQTPGGIEGPMDMLAEYLNENPEAAEQMRETQRVLQEKQRQRQMLLNHRKPGAPRTTRRLQPKTGRNAPCPCGSGKKFKKCCIDNHNV